MNILAIILCFCCIISSCSTTKSQVKESNKNIMQDSTDKIIDPLPEAPFYDIKERPKMTLPDSLGGSSVSGHAALKSYIDSTGSILRTDIVSISLLDNAGNTLIDYFNQNALYDKKQSYPKEVKRLYPWLMEYVNNIKFERNQNAIVRKLNLMQYIIRFQK